MNRETLCRACGTVEENNEETPETRSQAVEDKLIALDEEIRTCTMIDFGFLPAPHPLCRSCFVGWIHNVLGV